MRLLIVGGAGFIGCEVVRQALERGMEVVVLDSDRRLRRVADLTQSVRRIPFDFGRDRLTSSIKILPDDVVVHLAWTSVPASSMECPVIDVGSNVVASVQLFQDIADAQAARVVFASSGGTVYGNLDLESVTENHPTNPTSMYGASKLAVEKYLAVFLKLSGVSLRIGNPYGPYQFRGGGVGAAAKFVSAVQSGQEITIYGDGSTARDYIAVSDVVRAILLACRHEVPAGEYNVGTGECCSLNTLLELVFACSGKKTAVRYLPGRDFDVRRIALDSSKLNSICSWVPTCSLLDGVTSLVNAYRERVPIRPIAREMLK